MSSGDFTAPAPNRLFLSDITEHWTGQGKLYLRAVKDLNANRMVGYSIDARMTYSLAVAALDNARRRADGAVVAGCVLHTDPGSQFRSRKLVHQLHRHGMVGLMAAAGDNAATESFFALLQKNLLGRRRWATPRRAAIAIVTWIERTYHRRRRQAGLDRLTQSDTSHTPIAIRRPSQPVTHSCSVPDKVSVCQALVLLG